MKRTGIIALLMVIIGMSAFAQQRAKHTFALGDTTFLLDGKPFLMISGEMHYPRVPRECWRARMKMAKAMGLNTIGTYVFWNVHEPEQGEYDFSENNDIAAFVKTAQEEGLWVVLRPSPYVCAEWEFGGYPYWLQKIPGLVVRSKESQYLDAYRNYIMAVGKQLSPLLVENGGNILMVQIENEYGSYASDKDYLDVNRKLFIDAGFKGLLYTCDPEPAIKGGHLPGLLPAINGVDDPSKVKRLINENHNGKGPYYIAEWYPAWFDWWGTKHHTVPYQQYLGKLDSVLSAGISINMYMFHGGTTRGFMNGANANDRTPYEPQISSYDYDAPLDEAGNPTEKFMEFRKVIAKHLPAGTKLPKVPAKRPVIKIPGISLSRSIPLGNFLSAPVSSKIPLTFEDLGQAYGWVLYNTKLDGSKNGWLKLRGLRDYCIVMVNGRRVGVLDRRSGLDSIQLQLPAGEVDLDLLVENLGRINFGPYLLSNKKGITGKVTWADEEISAWEMYKLPFSEVPVFRTTARDRGNSNGPVVKMGGFSLTAVGDTYLDMSNWGKGTVWINGHNLGRYWEVGPQQTLFVPAEWLLKGENDIVVLELLKKDMNELSGIEHSILDVLK
jgi:beta-galactosidase